MSFNVVDAAKKIQDGVAGLIEEVKIGDLICSALTGLDNPRTKTITRKPMQADYVMTDAAVEEPQELVMDICLANPDFSAEAGVDALLSGDAGSFTETWRDKRDELYQMFDDTEVVTVQTHESIYESMLIQSIVPRWDVNENSEAFFATVTLIKATMIDVESVGVTAGVIDKAKEALGGL